jgi:hypothetical protein
MYQRNLTCVNVWEVEDEKNHLKREKKRQANHCRELKKCLDQVGLLNHLSIRIEYGSSDLDRLFDATQESIPLILRKVLALEPASGNDQGS